MSKRISRVAQNSGRTIVGRRPAVEFAGVAETKISVKSQAAWVANGMGVPVHLTRSRSQSTFVLGLVVDH